MTAVVVFPSFFISLLSFCLFLKGSKTPHYCGYFQVYWIKTLIYFCCCKSNEINVDLPRLLQAKRYLQETCSESCKLSVRVGLINWAHHHSLSLLRSNDYIQCNIITSIRSQMLILKEVAGRKIVSQDLSLILKYTIWWTNWSIISISREGYFLSLFTTAGF